MGGGKFSELHQFNPEHDESFDSFSFDESFSSSDESLTKAVKISGRTKRSSNVSYQEQKDIKGATDNVPCDAEDEEEDFVEQGRCFGLIKVRIVRKNRSFSPFVKI